MISPINGKPISATGLADLYDYAYTAMAGNVSARTLAGKMSGMATRTIGDLDKIGRVALAAMSPNDQGEQFLRDNLLANQI